MRLSVNNRQKNNRCHAQSRLSKLITVVVSYPRNGNSAICYHEICGRHSKFSINDINLAELTLGNLFKFQPEGEKHKKHNAGLHPFTWVTCCQGTAASIVPGAALVVALQECARAWARGHVFPHKEDLEEAAWTLNRALPWSTWSHAGCAHAAHTHTRRQHLRSLQSYDYYKSMELSQSLSFRLRPWTKL